MIPKHLKRLLAFSTISHAGAILCGIALLQPEALSGAALYVVGHGLVKAALFQQSGSSPTSFCIQTASPLKRRSKCLSWMTENCHVRFLEGQASSNGVRLRSLEKRLFSFGTLVVLAATTTRIARLSSRKARIRNDSEMYE